MILLDYTANRGWDKTFTSAQLEQATESDFVNDAFLANLVWIVNGVDLSWPDDIPMLQFAKDLFSAVCALSPDDPHQEFIVFDLVPVVRLDLAEGSDVSIRRSDPGVVATARLSELIRASARFGLRVYDDFLAAYPSASNNEVLKHWYPYAAMVEAAV